MLTEQRGEREMKRETDTEACDLYLQAQAKHHLLDVSAFENIKLGI